MISQNIQFTKEGIEELKKELEEKKRIRPGILSELQRARELGDLSENGLYKATKGQLIDTDRRIRHINHLIKHSKVVEFHNTGTIKLGNTVEMESNGKKLKYQLVGTYESNPAEGKISIESPIGKLLLNKKAGETIELKRDDTILKFKILNLS